MARITYRKSDGYTVEGLCQSANDHLVSAMHLFMCHGPQTYDSAGYLSHLGVELLLKAALLDRTEEFPNEHNLKQLIRRLQATGFALGLSSARSEALELLDSFSELRYPEPEGLSPIGDESWATVYDLYEWLLVQLPASLGQAIQQINHAEKSGRLLLQKPVSEG